MSSTDSPRLIGGRYQFGQRLGIGGMGVVYRATDLQTGQAVAIKMLKPAAGQLDPSMIERFCREADALRQLDHPNIVKVLETVEEGDQHYIVMEFISGGSLALLLGPQARLPLNRILQISLQVADALTRAHYLKIVHRDIKPGNVLLDEGGTIYAGWDNVSCTDHISSSLVAS